MGSSQGERLGRRLIARHRHRSSGGSGAKAAADRLGGRVLAEALARDHPSWFERPGRDCQARRETRRNPRQGPLAEWCRVGFLGHKGGPGG